MQPWPSVSLISLRPSPDRSASSLSHLQDEGDGAVPADLATLLGSAAPCAEEERLWQTERLRRAVLLVALCMWPLSTTVRSSAWKCAASRQ